MLPVINSINFKSKICSPSFGSAQSSVQDAAGKLTEAVTKSVQNVSDSFEKSASKVIEKSGDNYLARYANAASKPDFLEM